MKGILLSIIKIGAYVSLFVPLAVSPGVVYPFVLPKAILFYAVVEIIFLAWLVLAATDKKFRPKENLLLYAVLLFVAMMALASFRGINTTISVWSTLERMGGMITLIHGFLYFLVLSSVFRSFAQWRGFLATAVFVGSAVAAIFFLGESFPFRLPETRAGSTLGNSSFFGAYAVFPLFFAILLALKQKFGFLKIAAAAGFVLIFAAIYYANSRAAFYGVSGGLFLIFVSWLTLGKPLSTNKIKANIAKLIVRASWFLVSVLVVIGGLAVYSTLTKDAGIKARTLVWESAWNAAKERPVLGWGPENFNAAFFKYYNPCMVMSECGGEVWFDHSHNVIFDTLVDGGFMGLFAYLAIFGAALYLVWRKFIEINRNRLKFMEVDGENKFHTISSNFYIFPSIITALFAAYFVQNLFVFDMPASYAMFFFALAFVAGVFGNRESLKYIGINRNRSKFTEINRNRLKFMEVDGSNKFHTISTNFYVFLANGLKRQLSLSFGELALLASFFVFVGIAFYLLPFKVIKEGVLTHRFVARSLPMYERARLYTASLALSPLGNSEAARSFLSQVTVWLNRGNNVPDDIIALAQGTGEEAARENAGDLRVFRALGDFYIAATRFTELQRNDTKLSHQYLAKARDTLERATALSPKHQEIIPMLVQTYVFKRDAKTAKDILEKGIAMEPRYPKLYWNLGEVYMLEEKYDEAGRQFEEALLRGYNIANEIEKVGELAQAYYESGNYKQAAFWYKKIVDTKPNDPEARWTLATIYKKLDDYEAAREQALIVKMLDEKYVDSVNSFIGGLK